MGRLLGRLVVGLTLLLICFIAYSSQIFIIWPWYGSELSVELLYLLLPFNVLVGMLLWNYWLSVITNPGRVPDSWQPDVNSSYEVKKYSNSPRYCRTCKRYKPPRAHHCKQCGTCVLRMDHHCPWINNCVGYYNYGHFIRFLFYVDVSCSYHLLMITRRVFDSYSGRRWTEPSALELVFIVLNYATCVPVLLAVGGFSIYHFYCLMGNSTTIEGWEKDKVATLVRRGQIREVKFPYNLGKKRNIAATLGKNPLFWCWPTKPPGNGLKYELADGDDSGSGAAWPPSDPTAYNSHKFTLPPNPWTYQNGSLNPNLQPSNSQLRGRSSSAKKVESTYSVPPYHPDYKESPPDGDRGSDAEDDYWDESAPRKLVRRGSEGYEVRPVDREGMLRQYVFEQTHMQGRYNIYVPELSSESEGASEGDGFVANGTQGVD